jgi:uncharacterized membrane protein YgdD (TMEM256/DUF423 family)
MSFRIWLFLAALSSVLAVIASAYGAHTLNFATTYSTVTKIYETANLYHLLHSLALLGVAILLAATEGRRNAFAGWALQIAAFGFLFGMALFSGGIYFQVLNSVQTGVPIVPVGGGLFMLGWAALAVSSFGLRGKELAA